jgi:tetratricopeptide (TPR) repeat protein
VNPSPRPPLILRVLLGAALLLAATAAPSAVAGATCTVAAGQAAIDAGDLKRAVREFGCIIDAEPTGIDGYRGRIEANLLLQRYAAAVTDAVQLNALVVPVHPDAEATMLAEYAARLAQAPDDIAALTGASFTEWWAFDYPHAIHVLDQLLAVQPDDPYATLFRGSSRVLAGVNKAKGVADLERAISLDPSSADVRFIVADAYTYGQPDPVRALAEATRAFEWGLDTPRVHAILATAYNALGETKLAADHIQRHLDLVTEETVSTPALAAGATLTLDLVPGRTYAIPIVVAAGESISITTSSPDFWDSIALLVGPDGTPVLGSDDDSGYFAAFAHVAATSGTYVLLATSFESASTGALIVERD